ncbi:hypothetical protein RBB50_002491 [Rhinocladiella similis]
MSDDGGNQQLDGCPIHPLWRDLAFRKADFREYLSFPDLDKPEYNIDEVVYDRMKPGLRLATLFLEEATPELARIFYAGVEPEPNAAGHPGQRLKEWRGTPDKQRALGSELVRLSKMYRVTALDPQGGDPREINCPFAKTDTAITDLVFCPTHTRPHQKFYPQSAISNTWQAFFERQDWDTISDTEKEGRLLLLAVTLIHELAHVVWFHRVSRYYELALKRGRKDYSDIEFDPIEPKFAERQWAETGYVIEELMLGGFLSYSNVVPTRDTTPHYPIPPTDRVLFTTRQWTVAGHSNFRVNEVKPFWISELFSQETWERDANDAFVGNFHVVRHRLTEPYEGQHFILRDDPIQ